MNRILGLLVLAGLVFAAGCRSDRMVDISMTRAFVATPQPPALIAGPAALLLTKVPGFSAKVELQTGGQKQSGVLFGRAGKLLFVPDEGKPSKHAPSGRFSFIWDVAKAEGWLLSDALQGYAPVSLSGMGRTTNLVTQTAGASSVATTTTVAFLDNGKQQTLSVIYQGNSREIPSAIQGGEPPFNASISKIALKVPEQAMFQIPAGFTAYPSAEALVDEIATRFRNLNRRLY